MTMRRQMAGAFCAGLFSLGLVSMADAAFVSRLGGQAYYDNQLDITWTADANINGLDGWNDQLAWAAGLTIEGVGGWRLPNMDINGDGAIIDCRSATQAACVDNEYGHLYFYGAGTIFDSGVTADNPDPFSNIQTRGYWSSTEDPFSSNPAAWDLRFNNGVSIVDGITTNLAAWAVRSGDVSAVPVPAAVWLLGSGLLGLVGIFRRNKSV